MPDVAAAPSAPASAPSSSAPSGAAPAPGARTTADLSAASTATPAPAPGETTATPPSTPGEATPSAPPRPKTHRFKVNGQEREIEAAHVEALSQAFGMPPEEILKLTGMAQSSYDRWREAAKLRKEAEEQAAALKKRYEDPRVAAVKQQNPGLSDDDAWALAKVQEMYEREQMNPDQRALAEERAKREALERKDKERDETEKKAREQAETKAEAGKLDRELTDAITKHGLPKNPAWARQVLEHMAAVVRAGGVPDVEGSTIVVKQRIQRDDRARLAAMSDEQLEGWIGKDITDRILKRSVEKVRGPGPATVVPAVTPAPTPEGRKFLSEEEWRAKYGGR